MAPEFWVYVPPENADAFRESLESFGAELRQVKGTKEEKYKNLGITPDRVRQRIESLTGDLTPEEEVTVLPSYLRMLQSAFYYQSFRTERLSGLRQDVATTLLDIMRISIREPLALIEYFGLENGQKKSYRQVGLMIGTSGAREVVRKALRRMRHPSRSALLRGYLSPMSDFEEEK